MRIGWQSLRFLWEEESPATVTALDGVRDETTGSGPRGARTHSAGAPLILRKAARWSAIAVVGATIVGQIIGVRLVARVDADTSYTQKCRQSCIDSLCAGKTGRAYLQCYASKSVADCCAKCK